MTTRLPLTDQRYAVALATLGFRLTPKWTLVPVTGKADLTWFLDARTDRPDRSVKQASALIQAWAKPRKKQQALNRSHAEHPFCVALHAIEALATIQDWLKHPQSIPCAVKAPGRLLRLVPSAPAEHGVTRVFWANAKPSAGTQSPHFAAALAVCGFPPYPAAGSGGTLFFAKESITFPGLTFEAVSASVPRPGVQAVEALPGFAAGEHPFTYALQAAVNWDAMIRAAQAARPKPNLLLRGYGTRSAVVPSVCMAAGSRTEEHVMNFLQP